MKILIGWLIAQTVGLLLWQPLGRAAKRTGIWQRKHMCRTQSAIPLRLSMTSLLLEDLTHEY